MPRGLPGARRLGRLPSRQREALLLRYFGDLSGAQSAAVMGISRGAVKSHTGWAMSALHSAETFDITHSDRISRKGPGTELPT
jgi:hypothetical protein